MKKFKPILFSTPMVQAILDGRKTQTRRSIKQQPQTAQHGKVLYKDRELTINSLVNHAPILKGDILWVREAFYQPISAEFIGKYYYRANLAEQGWNFTWKPSIFMPRAAARIFLKVTNVRAERLQDISDTDAIAEGIALQFSYLHQKLIWKDYLKASVGWDYEYAVFSFQSLWESINGQKSWAENPWVWVYDFERIEKPKGFDLTI